MEEARPKPSLTLDCRGLYCPLPIIKTAQALKGAGVGFVVELLADDPGVEGDMLAWSKGTGNPILESGKEGRLFRFLVKKGSGRL